MVALEAMERARPVIAARDRRPRRARPARRDGLLVPPGEAEPLADAIVELARDPGARGGDGRGRPRRALERFPQERCTDRTELLYRARSTARRQRAVVRGERPGRHPLDAELVPRTLAAACAEPSRWDP